MRIIEHNNVVPRDELPIFAAPLCGIKVAVQSCMYIICRVYVCVMVCVNTV
jgi:hypothetical protein